jgi:hypothetical protein
MSRRKPAPMPEPEPAAAAVDSPRRGKPPARESRIFQPSTFASRKAEADARNAILSRQRLASLGPTEYTQRNTRNGKIEVLEAELFVDVDHPTKRYVTIQGIPGVHPLFAASGDREKVENLGPMPRRRNRQSLTRDVIDTPERVQPI